MADKCCPATPGGAPLIMINQGADIPRAVRAALRAQGIRGDIGSGLAKSGVYAGWAHFSSSVADPGADGTIVNLKAAASVMSSPLIQLLGFTADNSPVAGFVKRARLTLDLATADLTGTELDQLMRSMFFNLQGTSSLDVRYDMYRHVETLPRNVDAQTAAAPGVVIRDYDWDTLPAPLLLQFREDTVIRLAARAAVTTTQAVRFTIGLYGVWWQNTTGNVRSDCLPQDIDLVANAIAIPPMVERGLPTLPPPR